MKIFQGHAKPTINWNHTHISKTAGSREKTKIKRTKKQNQKHVKYDKKFADIVGNNHMV